MSLLASLTTTQCLALIALLILLYPTYLFLDYALLTPYRRYRLLATQGIHGPPFIPFIGALPQLAMYVWCDNLVGWGTDLERKYGLISRHERGPINVLQLQDADFVLAAWKTQAQHYQRGSVTPTCRTVPHRVDAGEVRVSPYVSNVCVVYCCVRVHSALCSSFAMFIRQTILGKESLGVVEGSLHSRYRQMISPALHYTQLRAMSSIMADETIAAIDALCPPSSPPTTVELHSWFTSLTLSIIGSSSFGDSLDHIPHAKDTLRHSLTTMLNQLAMRTILLVNFIPVIRSLPILGKTDVDRGQADYNAVVLQMVADKRAGRSKSKCEGRDLLDLLLEARDPQTNECFTDGQVQAQVATFLFAGHETTSSLMTWVLRDLLTRPKLWQQLRDEVERVTEGKVVTADHLPQLTLIDACIHESFRLRPPAHQLMIEAVDDHWLQPQAQPGGELKPAIFVPKGTCVFHDIWAGQRSKEVWGEDAEVWDEQRWVKGSDRYRKPSHPAAFMAFGGPGGYSCIGANFALMEARVMLAEIVRRVDMEMVPGQVDSIKKRLTIIPRYGLKANVRRVPAR